MLELESEEGRWKGFVNTHVCIRPDARASRSTRSARVARALYNGGPRGRALDGGTALRQPGGVVAWQAGTVTQHHGRFLNPDLVPHLILFALATLKGSKFINAITQMQLGLEAPHSQIAFPVPPAATSTTLHNLVNSSPFPAKCSFDS